MSEEHESGAPGHNSHRPSDGASGGSALPPPAFPPGSRRHQMRRAASTPKMGDAFISPDEPLPDRADDVADAFISPDEPIVRSAGTDDAFISPDDPIPHREPRTVAVADDGDDDMDVVVTGMGDDAHLDPEEMAAGGDPHVMELVARVSKLAEALKRRGEAGLRTTPDMDRFEATLRAYCVGYLAGRRAEDDPSPEY